MTLIVFTDVASGRMIGRVRVGDSLVGEGMGMSVVRRWLATGGTVAGFVAYYRDWSNGYVTSGIEKGEVGDASEEEAGAEHGGTEG